MIKRFVITLGDPNRKKSTSAQLTDCDFEYVDAVKTTLVKSIKNLSFDYERYRKHNKNYLADGAVGCALSHHKIYQKIVDEKLEGALILEDDFILNFSNKIMNKVINDVQNSEIDICLLGYSKMNKFDIFNYNLSNPFIKYHPLNEHFYFGKRVINTSSGAVGYYISNKAAEKIINTGAPFYVADEWPLIENFDIEIYHVSPCLVKESQIMNSSIEAERSLRNRKTNTTLRSVAVDILKIPFRFVKGRARKWRRN